MLSEQQQRIMGYFIEEAKDHLNTIEQGLLNLQSTIADPELVHELFRAAHSVKGGAAMLGLTSIQLTSHRLEDYFKVLKECRLNVDQKLESLLLRVFDTLSELLEQLQGPFGLTSDRAAEVMSNVEPVFTELNQHLALLVNQSGSTPPEDVHLEGVVAKPQPQPVTKPQPAVAEESALKLIFQSDVPARLRDMLQLFKQPDTATTRQQLQDLCRSLAQPGEQFELPNWCQLLEQARRAIGSENNTYRTLAPAIIKDVKQAQELVLTGRAVEICASPELLELLPAEPELVEDALFDSDFADLLASIDSDTDEAILTDIGSFSLEPEPASFDLSTDLPADSAEEEDWFSAAADLNSTTDLASEPGLFDISPDLPESPMPLTDLNLSLSPDDSAPRPGRTGPEVGAAELNSLADLFEGETPDLGMTWQSEPAPNPADSPNLMFDGAGDFSDLLDGSDDIEDLVFEQSAEDEDLSGLLSQVDRQSNSSPGSSHLTAASEDISEFDLADELNDLLQETANPPEAQTSDDLSFFDLDLGSDQPSAQQAPSNFGNLDELFAGLGTDDLTPETSPADAPAPADDLASLFGVAPAEASEEPAPAIDLLDLELQNDAANEPDLFLDNLFAAEPSQDSENSLSEFWGGEPTTVVDPPISPAAEPAELRFDEQPAAQSDAEPVDFWSSVDLGASEDHLVDLSSDLPAELPDELESSFADTAASLEPEALDANLFDDVNQPGLEDFALTAEPFSLDALTSDEPNEASEFDLSDEQPFNLFDDAAEPSDASDEQPFNLFDDAIESSTPAEAEESLEFDGGSFDDLLAFESAAEHSIPEAAATDALLSDDLGDNRNADLDADLVDLSASPFDFADPTEQAAADAVDDAVDTELSGLFESDLFGADLSESAAHTSGAPESGLNHPDQTDREDLISFDQPLTAAEDIADQAAAPDLWFDDLVETSDSEPAEAAIDDISEASEAAAEEPADIDFAASFGDFLEFADSSEEPSDSGDLDEAPSLESSSLTASLLTEPVERHSEQQDSADHGTFDDLEAMLGPEAAPEPAAAPASDSFDDLEAMLADKPAAPQTDDFLDLEALLDAGEAPAPIASPAPAPAAAKPEDGFDDLEALLQDADKTLGVGSSPSIRTPAGTTARRPSRRNVLSDQTMRVSVKNLDNLNNLVGELVVNRNGLEQSQERLRQFLDNLLYQVQQLSDVGQRMRDLYERSLLESSLFASRRPHSLSGSGSSSVGGNGQTHATGVSFDALEMDRFTGFHTLSQEMIELIVRVREAASDIDFVVDETDQTTRIFRQVTTQLQEGLTRSRMVPFAQTADRLPRAVRDIALQNGKQAELVIEGRETLIDKMILEQLYDPMTHLVNNAIAHGIETPEERVAAGKPATGRITIRTFHQGNQTVISVSDDGAGINPEVIKRKAIEKGLITAAQAKEMSRLDIYDLIFHHGFSTKDKADNIAGRGVGMDVVRTCLSEIRGVINIDSAVGKGTTFTIRLPLTLSISKALCCISNRGRIAFPMDGVEDMLDVPKDRIQKDSEGRSCIYWRDTLLPFQLLSDLLKHNRILGRGSVYGGNQEEDIVSVVVLRSAGNFLALQVDQVLGEQEIVIKQLEGPVPKPIGIAGATVLGDGRIMPIADVLELIDLSQGRIRREAGNSLWDSGEELPPEPDLKSEPTVLIVDDSITVRELLSMTFNKVGYRVEQARDGQEAWEKLRSGLPCDLVFCDIEMPRMDGLELLSRIQKDPNLSHLPIAMLTSRGADRHRQMAVQLGAKGYFTKPYLEEALLDAAQRMLKGEMLVG